MASALRYVALALLVTVTSPSMGADDESAQRAQERQKGERFRFRLGAVTGGETTETEAKLIKVRGRIVRRRKGFGSGPNVVIEVIDGRATQEYIERPLRAEQATPAEEMFGGTRMPKLEIGATYELEGYKRGQYVGTGPLILDFPAPDSFGPEPPADVDAERSEGSGSDLDDGHRRSEMIPPWRRVPITLRNLLPVANPYPVPTCIVSRGMPVATMPVPTLAASDLADRSTPKLDENSTPPFLCSDIRCLCFERHFGVITATRIDPIRFVPADFVDREALIEGRAVTRNGCGFLRDDDCELLVRADESWPTWMENKRAEAFGIVRRGTCDHKFHVEAAVSRLVNLKDQVGRDVELRGTAWSLNGDWWFSYRSERCYVEGLQESEPWKNGIEHAKPMVVRGVLETAKLPPLFRQRSAKREKPTLDWPEQYIVRRSTWEPVEKLLSPEHDNKPH
jgi:hypothetical protein